MLFVVYDLCLSLSLAWANTRTQAIEMGVINYLWPCLTVFFPCSSRVKKSVFGFTQLDGRLFRRRLDRWWQTGGVLATFSRQYSSNPLSYTLAFSGAIIWAIYCNLTRMSAQGKNGITWFFIATAITLWIGFALSDAPAFSAAWSDIGYVLLAGAAMGGGYGLWNLGILKGTWCFLATLSYFIPILSTFLSAILLSTELTLTFWQGVAMVTLGSLASWWLTRAPTSHNTPSTAKSH
ncbi:aromatic amino acid DMT transporter YddG [Salinivibrio sp. YCSC6]|uniref:aromatic amino acid DMT transporter YddG n=1 Tax=Salinivibrio sp. YCSC6 TaxID=2003370 RepID=UPI00273A025F|nr:aromatic amino acid DMT transporter YddG [Salinivibrio sp. YCSC6]